MRAAYIAYIACYTWDLFKLGSVAITVALLFYNLLPGMNPDFNRDKSYIWLAKPKIYGHFFQFVYENIAFYTINTT